MLTVFAHSSEAAAKSGPPCPSQLSLQGIAESLNEVDAGDNDSGASPGAAGSSLRPGGSKFLRSLRNSIVVRTAKRKRVSTCF